VKNGTGSRNELRPSTSLPAFSPATQAAYPSATVPWRTISNGDAEGHVRLWEPKSGQEMVRLEAMKSDVLNFSSSHPMVKG
jgi:hypothetical protein